MILWGEIREFPLFTVLQFLAGLRQTGVLEIQDYEELGAIYMDRGRIQAISMPSLDEKLAARLVKAGSLSQSQVKECLIQYADPDVSRPVPAGLLELAKAESRDLVEIVNRHTADAVVQLMYWNSGTFRLKAMAEAVPFTVVPSLKVEHLLLDAYRRVDEGEKPWRDKTPTGEELCLTCTLECSAEIRGRYLKPDICLWRSMPSILKEPIYLGLRRRDVSPEEGEMEELPFI